MKRRKIDKKNEVVMLSKEIERVAKKFLETSKRDN